MKITLRGCLWVGLAAMVALSLLWDRFPARAGEKRLGNLPAEGLGFAGRDLPLNATEVQVYRNAETVKRLYQAGARRFIVTAIDGSRNRHAVHDPLYCFRGDGWHVAGKQSLSVPGGRAQLLRLIRDGRQTEVVFWFTDSRERNISASRAWWLSLLHRLTFGQSGCETVLVLLQPASGETPSWSSVFARCPFLFEI